MQQTFSNLFEVMEAMDRWQQCLKSAAKLKKLFNSQMWFTGPELASYPNLHAYPGVDGAGHLVFFVIPDEYDTHLPADEIFRNIRPSATYTLVEGQIPVGISNDQAQKRIADWQNNYLEWLQYTAKTGTMYQAFRIPCQSMTGMYNLFFALKQPDQKLAGMSGFVPDLVIDVNGGTYDTVRSVPPFDRIVALDAALPNSDPDTEDKFYLLSFFRLIY